MNDVTLDNGDPCLDESQDDAPSVPINDAKSHSKHSDSLALDHAFRMAQPKAQLIGTLPVGTLLANGRIVVGRRMGGGAMGTVYEAEDEGGLEGIRLEIS